MARAPAKNTASKTTAKNTASKTTASKPTSKKVASKTAGKKVASKPRKPRKPAGAEPLDLDEALSVEGLLARGAELEVEREERAAREREHPRPVRDPVPVRPAAPVHWGYSFYLDETLPDDERADLKAWLERFTELSGSPSSGFFVVGPATDPERRRAAWDALGSEIDVTQLRAQMPPDEQHARLERLRRVLAAPASKAWSELVMLLSTWDAAGLDEAIAVADEGLARWPDELRAHTDKWDGDRRLRGLARTFWPKDLADGIPDECTTLRTQDLEAVVAHQHALGRLRSLELSGKPDLPAAVVGCGALVGLERLILHQPTYSHQHAPVDLVGLLAAPHLQQLTALSLSGYTFTPADLDALAECPQPLVHLRLENARMPPEAGRALARVLARKRLRTLHLKYNDLGPAGAGLLFADPDAWQTLRALDLSANEIGDPGVLALAQARLGELRWLNLSSNDSEHQLTAAAARALAGAPDLGNLRTLNLHGHPVGADGVAALLHAPGLRGLRELNVAFADASLADIVARAGDDPVPLEVLNLGNLQASKKRLDLGRAAFLRGVRHLGLDALDGGEYAAVLACPHLDDLEVLVLGGGYSRTERGFAAMIAADPPPGLRYLGLSGWKLTREQAARFAASPLGRRLWGVELMSSYTPPEAWYELYRAGLPTVGSAMFDAHAPSEYTTDTTFRDEL